MPSKKELEEEVGNLSESLSLLLDQTVLYSADELLGSKEANEEGDKAVAIIKEIIGDEHSLDDFVRVVPVRNAVYAGAFSLDSNIDHVKLNSTQFLTILAYSAGAASPLMALRYVFVMRSLGRASLIADLGAGWRIGFRWAYREGRMLSREGGSLLLARQGRLGRLGNMARAGRWARRASAGLAAVAVTAEIAGQISLWIRTARYKKELQEEITELKEALVEVFSDRANFYFDFLQMKSLVQYLGDMERNLDDDKEDLMEEPTYEAKKAKILKKLEKARKRLFDAVEPNQQNTETFLKDSDKKRNRKTNWDPSWATVKYTHDFTIAKIRVVSTNIVEVIQCVSRDGREGIVYGGATRLKDLPEGTKWWNYEIVLEPGEAITKATWKKTHVTGRGTTISGTAVWDLRLSTNKRELPALGIVQSFFPTGLVYDGNFSNFENDWIVLPVEGIMLVNKQRVDTSYKVTELIDANVTMEKVKGEPDVEIHNTNFIESLKFVIEMNTEPSP